MIFLGCRPKNLNQKQEIITESGHWNQYTTNCVHKGIGSRSPDHNIETNQPTIKICEDVEIRKIPVDFLIWA